MDNSNPRNLPETLTQFHLHQSTASNTKNVTDHIRNEKLQLHATACKMQS